MFNTPFPIGIRISKTPGFKIPDQIFALIAEFDNRLVKYKDRIDIRINEKEYRSTTHYNKRRKVAEIRIVKWPYESIDEGLTFVHELAHALDMLETADKGKDPHVFSKYLAECSAYKFTHKFMNKFLSEDDRKIDRYQCLLAIATTLFEIDIYTNEQQKYDKTFAKAVNRCYLKSRQKINPFYTLYKRHITSPLGELMMSMIEVELYLKEAGVVKEEK